MGDVSRKELLNGVHTALENLLKEIEIAYKSLNDEGERALSEGNYQKAKEAKEMATRLIDFHEKAKELQKEWQTVFSGILPPAPPSQRHQGRDRLRKGLRTPQHLFRRPILEALAELGGRAYPYKVLELVERKMKHILNDYDYSHHSNGVIRWQNSAHWCRYRMVKEGLLKSDSLHGIWEISEKGRQALEQGAGLDDKNEII